MAPVLGYWKIRGLAEPIRLLLTYAGEEFEEKLYESGPAPDFDRSQWLNEKFKLGLDFPNLPYYIDGDTKITQSSAIIRYIARKHKLAGSTEEELVRIDVVENQLIDLNRNFVNLCYNPKFESLKPDYVKNLPDALKHISEFLGKSKFLAGDNVTFVDFLAYSYISKQLTLAPNCLENFPNLKEFQSRVENLPTVNEYIKNAPQSKFPMNGPMASFGNE